MIKYWWLLLSRIFEHANHRSNLNTAFHYCPDGFYGASFSAHWQAEEKGKIPQFFSGYPGVDLDHRRGKFSTCTLSKSRRRSLLRAFKEKAQPNCVAFLANLDFYCGFFYRLIKKGKHPIHRCFPFFIGSWFTLVLRNQIVHNAQGFTDVNIFGNPINEVFVSG